MIKSLERTDGEKKKEKKIKITNSSACLDIQNEG